MKIYSTGNQYEAIEVGECEDIEILTQGVYPTVMVTSVNSSAAMKSGMLSGYKPSVNGAGMALVLNNLKTPITPSAMPVRLMSLEQDTDKLMNLIGALVQRLGGGVVLDPFEVVKNYSVKVEQRQDPWGIVIRAEEV